MNEEKLYEAMGDIDEDYISQANTPCTKKKPLWVKWGAMAACLALLLGISIPVLDKLSANEEPTVSIGHEMAMEAAPVSEEIMIYYVDNGSISGEKQYLRLAPEDIFKAWKEKNGIGDEVTFISARIEDNSSTHTETYGGQTVVVHTMGDYFAFHLTVSKNIENYFDGPGQELLLSTLEKTMREYSNIEFDDYKLILE